MRERIVAALAIIVTFALLQEAEAQTVYQWTGGVSNDWKTGGNWNNAGWPSGGGQEGWFGTNGYTANLDGDAGSAGSRNDRIIQGPGSSGSSGIVNINNGATLYQDERYIMNYTGGVHNSTLNINAGGTVDITGQGDLLMNSDSHASSRQATINVAGTLLLSDDLFVGGASSNDTSSAAGDVQNITIKSGGLISVGDDVTMSNFKNSIGTFTIEDGGTLDFGPGDNRRFQMGARGTATLNLESGGVLSDVDVISVGHEWDSQTGHSTINLNGGTLSNSDQVISYWSAHGESVLNINAENGNGFYDFQSMNLAFGGNNASEAIVNQADGTVHVRGTIELSRTGSGLGEAFYNLEGGTLAVQTIDMTANPAGTEFNWGDGKLMRYDDDGLTVKGDLTTGATIGGQPYENSVLSVRSVAGVNPDALGTITITGDLSLAASNDTLELFADADFLLNGIGIESGYLTLVDVGGTLDGIFDNIMGFDPLLTYDSDIVGGLLDADTLAAELRQDHFAIFYDTANATGNGQDIYFLYNVTPEPATWLLAAFGAFGLLTIRRRRRKA